jgi:hypothetical protein
LPTSRDCTGSKGNLPTRIRESRSQDAVNIQLNGSTWRAHAQRIQRPIHREDARFWCAAAGAAS